MNTSGSTEAVDLKTCPFCGGTDTACGIADEEFGRFWVECICGARGPTVETLKDARPAWNKRLAPEPGGWQPIETAPKDGTQALMLYEPTREPGTLRRCVCQHSTAHGWFTVPGGFWLMPAELRGWLPLPSFPETASEKRRRETDMLAYKWMVAHDRLAAGLQYEFPSPANIPDALARVNELETFVRSVQVPTKDGTWKEVMFRLADEARVILAKGERS